MVFIIIRLCTPLDAILDIQWVYDKVKILRDKNQLLNMNYSQVASNSGLLASFIICGIADLANAWVRNGIGLNLVFLLLVTAPPGVSELTNHFLNFVLLMHCFVNL